MPVALWSLSELHNLMDSVEKETLTPNVYALEANPVINAAKLLYDTLREATDIVIIEGSKALDRAIELVMDQYELLKVQLKSDVKELLEIFQRQLSKLIVGTMEHISAGLPAELAAEPPRKLDSIAFKLALSLSPSISVAATEWLRLMATGGAEVQVTYKTSPTSL
jgi:hypothetical protein